MEIYKVVVNSGEPEYYGSLERAQKRLWEEYKDTYYEEDNDEERDGAYYSLTHENYIDGVGEIYEIEVK